MRVIVLALAAIIGLSSIPASAGAQTLPSPRWSVDSISVEEVGIAEVSQLAIAGGRFAWVSGRGQGVGLVDLERGRVTTVGRVGSGPGEYRHVSRVFGCDTYGGWVDGSLARVTWLAPDATGAPVSVQLPAAVVSRGEVTSAACAGDTVWMAIERRGGAQSANISDSTLVFRLVRTTGKLDTLVRLPATRRSDRSKGALRSSLRVPYTQSPVLVGTDAGPVVMHASGDSLLFCDRGRARSVGITGRKRRAISPAQRAALIDSIRQAAEDEMQALSYNPNLKREFRVLVDENLRKLAIPASMPIARFAAYAAARRSLVVVENSSGAAEGLCLSMVSRQGVAGPRRCSNAADRHVADRHVADRQVGALAIHANQALVGEWSEGGAWVRRVPLP
jgi:hypothetical protein